jgi:hypothetical protein
MEGGKVLRVSLPEIKPLANPKGKAVTRSMRYDVIAGTPRQQRSRIEIRAIQFYER